MKQELRILLTQMCNYKCYFCHHEGVKQIKENLLSSDDIKYLYDVSNRYFGINTVTLSGGEPLISSNVLNIVRKLFYSGCKTTVVTNGSLLDKKMDIGRYISKLNISLHSLNKEEYEKIILRKGYFDKVINNIYLFRKYYPFVEINLNYALINKKNIFDDVNKIIDFCKTNKVNVKFIELFPKDCNDFLSIDLLHDNLIKNGKYLLSSDERKFKFFNSNDSFIYTTKCLCSRSLDYDDPSKFCHNNNDLFITLDGSIKVCRILDDEISILSEIKNRDDEEVSKKLRLSFSSLGSNCPYNKMKGK